MPEPEARFMTMALDCVQREYPNKISHVLASDADAQTPRELHPAFYGCFDWHSSVHGHWMLVRLLRTMPDNALTQAATAALDANLTLENMAGEVAYFEAEGRAAFERPYGLAWLLQLGAELREWDDPRAQRWSAAIAPLEQTVSDRYRSWLPNLAYPIRIGTHNQSAFALALGLDWAREAGDVELESLIVTKAMGFHAEDRNCPIGYEPSGEDFLSPCLMEADLMRRVMPAADYLAWLGYPARWLGRLAGAGNRAGCQRWQAGPSRWRQSLPGLGTGRHRRRPAARRHTPCVAAGRRGGA